MAVLEYAFGLSWTTTIIIIFATCILATRIWFKKDSDVDQGKKTKGFSRIPGPRAFPLIGNAHLIRRDPHLSLMNLAKRYGNIFRIQLGSHPVLVLNGLAAIRKALVRQPATFAGRPDFHSYRLIHSRNTFGTSISLMTYSDQWKCKHSLTAASLRHFTSGGRAHFLESVITKDAQEFIECVSKPKTDADPTTEEGLPRRASQSSFSNTLRLSVSNIIMWYLFGERHSYDDGELIRVIELSDVTAKALAVGSLVDFFPQLRPFLSSSTRRLLDFRRKLSVLMDRMILKHYAKYQPGSDADIVDHLITSVRGYDQDELKRKELTERNFLQSPYDIFIAGFETTSTTLEWCVLYLIATPEIQADLQKEIDTVVGRDRLPTLDDQDNLPMVQSYLMEIQRHVTMVPLAFPHSATTDTTLEGFFIPKDTVVFVNLYSANHDPEVWDKPDEFNPRRFLDAQGNFDIEKSKKVINFSMGIRRCIGADLGKINTFLYFSILVHQLTFSAPEGMEVSTAYVTQATTRPKDLNVIATSRA